MPTNTRTPKNIEIEHRMAEQGLSDVYDANYKALVAKDIEDPRAAIEAELALMDKPDELKINADDGWAWVFNNLGKANVDRKSAPAAWCYTALVHAQRFPKFKELLLAAHLQETLRKRKSGVGDRFEDDARETVDLCDAVITAHAAQEGDKTEDWKRLAPPTFLADAPDEETSNEQ